jgi:hypothetical protein
MGIQFILGVRAERSRGSNPGDSRHFGSVREDIGELRGAGLGPRNRGAVWSFYSQRPCLFSSLCEPFGWMVRVLGDSKTQPGC